MGRFIDLSNSGFVCQQYRWSRISRGRIAAICALSATALILVLSLLRPGSTDSSQSMLLPALCGLLVYPVATRKSLLHPYEEEDDLPSSDPELHVIKHLEQVLAAGADFLEAKAASLTLFDAKTGYRYHWTLPGQRSPSMTSAASEAIAAPAPTDAWFAVYVRTAAGSRCYATDRAGRRLCGAALPKEEPPLWNGPYKTILTGRLRFGARWEGQLAVADAAMPHGKIHALRQLQQMIALTERSYKVYCSEYAQAAGRERERIARDLHHGITQSLCAAEMRIELLRRSAGNATNASVEEVLAGVQETLRQEVRTLRVQIEQLRSGCHSHALEPHLAELIRNFEADTGIATEFFCDLDATRMTPPVALEVIHIVGEALSNVRKHSHAKKTEIHLTSGRWLYLTIQNNGRSYGFTGCLSLAELQANRIGPRTICERVQAMGGNLFLESSPRTGSRLEIVLPIPEPVTSAGPETGHPTRHSRRNLWSSASSLNARTTNRARPPRRA